MERGQFEAPSIPILWFYATKNALVLYNRLLSSVSLVCTAGLVIEELHCALGGARLSHFMAKAPPSLFYGRGGVHLKIDYCRVIGAGPNLNPPAYHCLRLKRVESGKRLGSISLETPLLTT